MLVFPAVVELFSHSAAALRETGVADGMLVHEYLAACFLYGFHHTLVGGTGNALVALAMVVGAYVEDGMVFAVVPADVFCFGLEEGEEVTSLFAEGLPFFNLC